MSERIMMEQIRNKFNTKSELHTNQHKHRRDDDYHKNDKWMSMNRILYPWHNRLSDCRWINAMKVLLNSNQMVPVQGIGKNPNETNQKLDFMSLSKPKSTNATVFVMNENNISLAFPLFCYALFSFCSPLHTGEKEHEIRYALPLKWISLTIIRLFAHSHK